MKYLILTLLVVCTGFSLKAQEIDEDVMINKEVPGYILFDGQDTLWGKVKISTRSNNQVRVKFTDKSTAKEKTYKAKDEEVIAYGYKTRENNNNPAQIVYRWRHFHRKIADEPPAPFTSKTVFMEVKALGPVNLYGYYIQSNSQVEKTYIHYYLIEQKYSQDVEEYRTRKVTRDNFESTVLSFTENCKKIENVVSISKDYSKLDEIISLYNECQYEKIEGDCGECYKEKQEKEEKARKLREERAKKEQIEADEKFKSSKDNKNSKKKTSGHR